MYEWKCNFCLAISHLKCNDLNYVDGRCLNNSNISWSCQACCADIFSFTNSNNYKLDFSLNNTVKKYRIVNLIKKKHVLF